MERMEWTCRDCGDHGTESDLACRCLGPGRSQTVAEAWANLRDAVNELCSPLAERIAGYLLRRPWVLGLWGLLVIVSMLVDAST